MSLEAALAENTAAMKALTAALGAKAGGSKADAAIDKEAARATAAKATATAGKTAMTKEQFGKQWADYLAVDDEGEADERRGNLRAVIKHYGVERVTLIDPKKFAEAIGYLNQLKAGETPDFMAGDGGDEDDSLV